MIKQFKSPVDQAEAMESKPLEQQVLHDFVMNNVFGRPLSKEEAEYKIPNRQIGEIVKFYDPRKPEFYYPQNKKYRTDGDFEIVGIYDDNEKLYEDKSPWTEELLKKKWRPTKLRVRSLNRKNDVFDALETELAGYNYHMREPKKYDDEGK